MLKGKIRTIYSDDETWEILRELSEHEQRTISGQIRFMIRGKKNKK